MFISPPPKLLYYEDLYGQRNADEEFDRFPDICEEESSSSEESDKPKKASPDSPTVGFFARFRTPKRKHPAGGSEGGSIRSGENSRKKASPTANKDGKRYQIAPTQNRKHSLLVREKKKKKLTPRKGGLFATSFSAMDFDASTPNSAGEMMEDMLRAGAGAAMDFEHDFIAQDGDVDEDAFTRELRAAAYGQRERSPRIDPLLLLEDAARKDSGVDEVEIARVAAEGSTGEDGDVEDNAESASTKTNTKTKATRGRGKKKATPTTDSTVSRASKPSPAKPTAVTNTKTKVQRSSPTPTLSTRASARTAKTQPAAPKIMRPLRNSTNNGSAPAKAAQLQARNRSAMTARAVAMQNKVGARLTNKTRAKTLFEGQAGGRSVRLRNWKGEVINDACVVVIYEGKADGEEYMRY